MNELCALRNLFPEPFASFKEFSLEKSTTEEREHLLSMMEKIKADHPLNSITPANAKDLLYADINRWLEDKGRDNLNIRQTGWPFN
jgi:hypothetical protein